MRTGITKTASLTVAAEISRVKDAKEVNNHPECIFTCMYSPWCYNSWSSIGSFQFTLLTFCLLFFLYKALLRIIIPEKKNKNTNNLHTRCRPFETLLLVFGGVLALGIGLVSPWCADHLRHCYRWELCHVYRVSPMSSLAIVGK